MITFPQLFYLLYMIKKQKQKVIVSFQKKQ